MQLVAEYKIEFHGDEAVGVLGVVAAGLGGDNHGAFNIRVSASWAVHPGKHGGVIMPYAHYGSTSLNSADGPKNYIQHITHISH